MNRISTLCARNPRFEASGQVPRHRFEARGRDDRFSARSFASGIDPHDFALQPLFRVRQPLHKNRPLFYLLFLSQSIIMFRNF